MSKEVKPVMKKIGIIGGIGPESTVDYYRRVIALYKQKISKDDYPEIIINSINMTAMLQMVADKNWDALISIMTEAIHSLYKSGADFGFMASNTPHIVYEQIRKSSPIPIISIVEAARKEAGRLALKKTALLGTLFTMQSRYYQDEFNKSRIDVIVPNEKEQQYIHEKLFTEIENGLFLEETRDGLLSIIKRLIIDEQIDSVVLGCTELPLILTKDEFGIPFINTTKVHVESIIEYMLQ